MPKKEGISTARWKGWPGKEILTKAVGQQAILSTAAERMLGVDFTRPSTVRQGETLSHLVQRVLNSLNVCPDCGDIHP